MSKSNPLIKLIAENPADFLFGVVGVSIALAVENIAKPMAAFDVSSFARCGFFLVALALEFGIAALLYVYALHRAIEISRPRLVVSIVDMLFFSFILIAISAVPSDAPCWYFKIGMGLCGAMILLAFLCMVLVHDLIDHIPFLAISLALAELFILGVVII